MSLFRVFVGTVLVLHFSFLVTTSEAFPVGLGGQILAAAVGISLESCVLIWAFGELDRRGR